MSIESDNLRNMRRKFFLNQTWAGVLLGVTRKTISDWEAGKWPIGPLAAYAVDVISRRPEEIYELNGLVMEREILFSMGEESGVEFGDLVRKLVDSPARKLMLFRRSTRLCLQRLLEGGLVTVEPGVDLWTRTGQGTEALREMDRAHG